MKKVILYSTGCPQCKVLKDKLDAAGIEYDLVDDQDVMEEKGFMTAPMLEVDGEVMNAVGAFGWLNEQPAECESCGV